ncbi:hypothetical protein Tco_0474331 [Tanacetum coccineum]
MEKKDTLSSCSDSEKQQMQLIQDKSKESCMVSFQQLHSHLKCLSNNDLKETQIEYGFKRAFATLFGQDLETFTGTMFLYMDQLQKQLDNEEFQEIGFMSAFKVLETLFQRSLLHDNIVPKPDLALELGKSISLTEAEEAVAREVHATHARIKRSSDSSKKLKGIQTLTPAEQEAADIMKALKESKKMSKRQPGTRGSNEGTDVVSEHFDRDDNVGDDNEETKPDPEEIYK